MKTTDILREATIAHDIALILRQKGYQLLGYGVDQQAWVEPGTGLVLKIFGTVYDDTGSLSKAQESFKVWADYCMANEDNPFLPKFYGWTSFRCKGRLYLQIRTERLFGMTQIGYALSDFADLAGQGSSKQQIKSVILSQLDRNSVAQAISLIGDKKDLDKFLDTLNDLYAITKRNGWRLDLHSENFMFGSDGDIVINDPFYVKSYT